MKLFSSKATFVSMLLLTAVFFFNSCITVKLISDYDELTDQALHDLQQRTATYFVTLKRDLNDEDGTANYDDYTGFFDKAQIALNTLKIRTGAIEKNSIVQQQVNELASIFDNLEKAHKIGFQSAEAITPPLSSFNTAFTAIAKLQLALKRGNENP
ncbi:hypothetical protein [Marixanthomonas spongiae]|uniref:Uncharacterized protein n=1 Tax=Marixanthomonas spongiae TaxID=2174845 RepID=A0A2U0I3X0_9FLAO|nr:hypothetical protein [Marixanthomonas spongiae]PVW15807.1 hypothetical protein DDV96_05945 [Marixanthomonas spongiae]